MPSHQTLISQQLFYLDPVLLLDNHNLMSKLCSKDSWSRSTSDRLSSPILHRLWRLQCKCNPSKLYLMQALLCITLVRQDSGAFLPKEFLFYLKILFKRLRSPLNFSRLPTSNKWIYWRLKVFAQV